MSETKKPETAAAWTTYVALSTTILAVCAAFSTLKGGSYSTQTQLATVNAANAWSRYQAKSIRESGMRNEASLAKVIAANATTPEGKTAAQELAAKALSDADRYAGDKKEIQKEAESREDFAKYCQARGGNFGLAIMFLQIAIMLSAIAALLKKKPAWILGLVLGAIGTGYLVYAWPAYEAVNGAPPAIVKAK